MWLVFEDSGMSKGEHGLEQAEKDNEPGDQHPEIFDRCRDHQREYLLEDEFDEEFWLKVNQFLRLFGNLSGNVLPCIWSVIDVA